MSHRAPLLALIDAYENQYPEESMMVSRIREFVRQHQDCFKRSLTTGHVTGSAWVLDQRRDRVLLTHHRKLDIWVQLGGHADGESDIAMVALREAREESGLNGIYPISPKLFDIDIHEIPARGREPAHYHYDCRFLLQAVGSEAYVVGDESHDLAWIPLDKVTDYTSETSILRMLEKTPRAG